MVVVESDTLTRVVVLGQGASGTRTTSAPSRPVRLVRPNRAIPPLSCLVHVVRLSFMVNYTTLQC